MPNDPAYADEHPDACCRFELSVLNEQQRENEPTQRINRKRYAENHRVAACQDGLAAYYACVRAYQRARNIMHIDEIR